MDQYKIEILKKAKKQLAKFPRKIQLQIAGKIEALKNEPRPDGVKKISGESELYRISLAKVYRVIYQIKDSQLTILIIKFGHRKDIYR